VALTAVALLSAALSLPAHAHFDPGDVLNGAPDYLRTLNEQGPAGADGPQFPARYIAVRVDCRVVKGHDGNLYLVKSRAYPTSDQDQQSNDWYDDSGFHTTGLARRVAKFQRHQHACSLSCKYRPQGGEWCTGRKERHWVEPHTHNLEYDLGPDHPDADPDGKVRITYTQAGYWQPANYKCTQLPANDKSNWPGITMNLFPSQLWTRIDPAIYSCDEHCPRKDCRRAPTWQGRGN